MFPRLQETWETREGDENTRTEMRWKGEHSYFFDTKVDKGIGGSQRVIDSSPNLSFSDLKQKEIEIKEGSARVLWYETQLLIGQPNGGSPKLSKYQRG